MIRFASMTMLVFLLPDPAVALELFGVTLETTTRGELREAVKQAGVELIREGGENRNFDVYDPSGVMPGSSRLYLGFEPAEQRFAFAEYEFVGLDTRGLLADLARKYGDPEVDEGRFLSDRGYHWQRDGILIRLHTDWANYRTRLSYADPVALEALRSGQATKAGTDDGAASISYF